MEETTKNKEQKDDALTAAYMLGRYDGRKEVEAEARGWNVAGAIVAKHEFNKGRPYKHGKEF